jgi:hypothetical protein
MESQSKNRIRRENPHLIFEQPTNVAADVDRAGASGGSGRNTNALNKTVSIEPETAQVEPIAVGFNPSPNGALEWLGSD